MEPVVNMATWQTWQSKAMGVATERARQKFWGGAVYCTLFLGGCLLYSLPRPPRRKRMVLWVGCICTLAAHHMSRGKKTFDEAAIRGSAAQQLHSVYFSLALLPTTNVSRWELLPFFYPAPPPFCHMSTLPNSSSVVLEWTLLTSASVCLFICLLLALAFV